MNSDGAHAKDGPFEIKKKSPLQNIDQSKQGFPRGVLAKILEEPSHHVWRRSMVRTRKPKGWYMVIPSPVLKHLKLQWKHAFAESCFLRSAVANSELGRLCEKGVGTSHYWLPMLFPKHSQCQLKEIFKTWDVLHEICCIVLRYRDPIPMFIQF